MSTQTTKMTPERHAELRQQLEAIVDEFAQSKLNIIVCTAPVTGEDNELVAYTGNPFTRGTIGKLLTLTTKA